MLASQQPRVEALRQLGIDLPGLLGAQRRVDVQADQVVALLAASHPEVGDVQPLLDRLADRDPRLGMLLLVDLALQPRESDLGVGHGGARLPQPVLAPGQRIDAGVHDRPVAPRRKLLDVAADATTCSHGP